MSFLNLIKKINFGFDTKKKKPSKANSGIYLMIKKKTRNKKKMYALINLFNIILEVQANATTQKKEIKGIQIEKEGIKLFAEMTQWPIYRESHRIYKKILE